MRRNFLKRDLWWNKNIFVSLCSGATMARPARYAPGKNQLYNPQAERHVAEWANCLFNNITATIKVTVKYLSLLSADSLYVNEAIDILSSL